MIEKLKVMVEEPGFIALAIIMISLCIVLVIMIKSKLVEYIKIDKHLKDKTKKHTEQDINYIKTEMRECKDVIATSIGLIVLIILLFLISVNIKYDKIIFNNNLQTEVNQKIENGYEVFIRYSDGRDSTKVENYTYNIGDNIEVNDDNKEIYLKIDKVD